MLRGEKMAAVVMASDQTTRRAGEDALARELSARGAKVVPMHTLLVDADPDEAKARAPRDVHDLMDLYTTIDAIARETAAPADIVKALYEEETARLNAQARLKQFVLVNAIKRVKQRLRKLSQWHP